MLTYVANRQSCMSEGIVNFGDVGICMGGAREKRVITRKTQ